MIKKLVKNLSAIKWALSKNGRSYIKDQKTEQEGIKSSSSPKDKEEKQ